MKKKITLGLLPLLLVLASCGESTSSTDPNSSNPASDSAPTSEPVKPSTSTDTGNSSSSATAKIFEGAPKTITKLSEYLDTTARQYELMEGQSYHRTAKEVQPGILGGTKTIELTEDGTSYNNDVLLVDGNTTTTSVDSYTGTTEKSESKYQTFIGVKDKTFYLIQDVEGGKENDSLKSTAVTDKNKGQIDEACSLNMVSGFLTSYQYYLSSHIVSGFDDIEPRLTEDGLTSYTYKQVLTSTASALETASFVASFDENGNFVHYEFDYESYDIDSSTNAKTLYVSTHDSYTASYEELKTEFDFTAFNPLDYVMTDYEVGFVSNDGTFVTWDTVDGTVLPYDMYIKAVARNEKPSKALDTTLYITASSDPTVIKVDFEATSDGVYDSVKTLKEGSATLTVKSLSGITKTVDVTVKAPALTGLSAAIYGKTKFVGDRDRIYLTEKPSNSLDEIVYSVSDPSVAKVEYLTTDTEGINLDGYYVTYLKEGDFYVTFTKKDDPSITCTTPTYHVYATKMTADEIRALLPGTWTTSSMFDDWKDMNNNIAIEHTFNLELSAYEDHTTKDGDTTVTRKSGTGTVKFTEDWTRMPFRKDTSITFSYDNEQPFNTFRDRVIYDIEPFKYTADNTTYEFSGQIAIYQNGEMEFQIAPTDPNDYYLTLKGDLTKKVEA